VAVNWHTGNSAQNLSRRAIVIRRQQSSCGGLLVTPDAVAEEDQ
jgi:hypothetical protein